MVGVGGVRGVVFHCLKFWLVSGLLMGFSNGILMEFLISSTEVPFEISVGGASGSSGFHIVGWGSFCSIRAPSVSRCFCMWCSFSLLFQ